MKLGGLTWWRNNYGSILQAYALQQTLNRFDGLSYEIICQYGRKIASADNLKDKLKKLGLRKTLRRAFWKFGMKKLRMRSAQIQKFVDRNLKVSERQYDQETIVEANQVYDGFICGSDQIWNPALSPVDSIYWLGFAHEGKMKIAYAPSLGVDAVTDQQACVIRSNLSDFNAISCRENSGTIILNRILGENRCFTVLDPTLMADRSLWVNICAPRRYAGPYLFVYILRGTKEQRRLLENIAAQRRLKIVTMPFLDTEKIVPYDFFFGDEKLWDASPEDFISAIRYADCVFTDSFHCMAFSCLFHVDFFTFPKIGNAQMNRITGLQDMLRIPGRMIRPEDDTANLSSRPSIDWDSVDRILQEQREFSLNYLSNALKN